MRGQRRWSRPGARRRRTGALGHVDHAALGLVGRSTMVHGTSFGLAWPADVVRERALVVPVPLADVRLRERGYNQSALLAAAAERREKMKIGVLRRHSFKLEPVVVDEYCGYKGKSTTSSHSDACSR